MPRGFQPQCPYCQRFARFYPKSGGYIPGPPGAAWICDGFPRCDSWVRCFPDSDRPQGRLANAQLRRLKAALYERWGKILRKKQERAPGLSMAEIRRMAIRWLAKELVMEVSDCVFGLFDEQTTQRAIECLRPYTS